MHILTEEVMCFFLYFLNRLVNSNSLHPTINNNGTDENAERAIAATEVLSPPPARDFVSVHWGVTAMSGASSARAVQAGLERGAPPAPSPTPVYGRKHC